MEIVIKKKFAELLPPLSDDEFAELEESILKYGLKDPIKVWQPEKNGDMIIIDGHHRFKICKKHGIQMRTTMMEFADEDEAIEYSLTFQLGRRNLNEFKRTEVVLKKKEILERRLQAKERLKTAKPGIRGGSPLSHETKAIPINVRAEIAKTAKVSENTVRKVETIIDEAPKKVVNAVRDGKMSIRAAYNTIKPNLQKSSGKKKAALRFGGAFQVSIENIRSLNDVRRGKGNFAFKQSNESQEMIDPYDLIEEIKALIGEKGFEVI